MTYKKYYLTPEHNQWLNKGKGQGSFNYDFSGFYVRPGQSIGAKQREEYLRAQDNSKLEIIAKGLQNDLDTFSEEKTNPLMQAYLLRVNDPKREFDDDFDSEEITSDFIPLGPGTISLGPSGNSKNIGNNSPSAPVKYVDPDGIDTFEDYDFDLESSG